MKRTFTILFSLLLAGSFQLNSQTNHTETAMVCGVSPETNQKILQNLEENKAYLDEFPVRFRSTTYVPVKFHLVAKSDGSDRVSFDDVLDQLCTMNEHFAPLDMQFYLDGAFDLIDNSTVYTNHTAASFAMTSRNASNALNIWVVGEVNISGTDDGTIVTAYYDRTRGKDWIIIGNEYIGGGRPILTHEMGHFFSLLHPHLGWDSDPYDPEKHGNPAPARSPDGIATELQDGSNCEVAGDRICDTAPDYNNGLGWTDCDFTATVLDPNGTQINPDERLHMNYFFRCNTNRYFSNKQQQLMLADYASSRRNYIRTDFSPIATEINESPTLLEPANGATTSGFNTVFLEWSEVNGANQYLVEIDRLPTFTSSKHQEIIATTNSLEISDLEPGKRYFWRVKPFNEVVSCAFASNFISFTTGTTTSTFDFQEITQFSISPNPASAKQDLQIELKTPRAFEAYLQLYTITGQLIKDQGSIQFSTGKNIYQLPLEGLTPGVYLFSLQSELGKMTERIIVNR